MRMTIQTSSCYKMAAPLNTCTTIEQRGVVRFLWAENMDAAKDIHKEMLPICASFLCAALMGSISLLISFALSIFFAHKKRTTPRCSIVVHVFRGATILYQLLRLYSHAHTDLCASQ